MNCYSTPIQMVYMLMSVIEIHHLKWLTASESGPICKFILLWVIYGGQPEYTQYTTESASHNAKYRYNSTKGQLL